MKTKKLEIYREPYPENPRLSFDQLGVIAYKHNNYILGDVKIDESIDWLETKLGLELTHCYTNSRFEYLNDRFLYESNFIALPVFVYEHGGITISTRPFECRFDSCQLGYIYVTKKQIREEFGWKVITKKRHDLILEILRGEVKQFDDYLNNNVYLVEIKLNGEVIDSCGGYYGDDFHNNGVSDFIGDDNELQSQLDEYCVFEIDEL